VDWWIGAACAPLLFPLRQPRASTLKKKNLQKKRMLKNINISKKSQIKFSLYVDLIELIIFQFLTFPKVKFKVFDFLLL